MNEYRRQTVDEEMQEEKEKYFAIEGSLRRSIRVLAYVASLACAVLIGTWLHLDQYWLLVWIPLIAVAIVIAHAISTIMRQALVQYGLHLDRFSFLGGRNVGRKESPHPE